MPTTLLTADGIQSYLDQVYPIAPTVASLVVTFQASTSNVQVLLNQLTALRKIVQVTSNPATYQGGIVRTLQQLQLAYPKSLTIGTIVSQLKFNTSTVQADIQRLLILGQVDTITDPVSGAISYVALSKG